jgi:hypothetical protein
MHIEAAAFSVSGLIGYPGLAVPVKLIQISVNFSTSTVHASLSLQYFSAYLYLSACLLDVSITSVLVSFCVSVLYVLNKTYLFLRQYISLCTKSVLKGTVS